MKAIVKTNTSWLMSSLPSTATSCSVDHRQHSIGEITGVGLRATCLEDKKSAPGPDQWSTFDFCLLDDTAFDWIDERLNCIEGGLDWPTTAFKGMMNFETRSANVYCLLWQTFIADGLQLGIASFNLG